MQAQEIYDGIREVLEKIILDMPKRNDEPIFECRARVYYSDDCLNESDEYLGKDTSTVWGELSFEARGGKITDESLCFSLAIDLDKSGRLLEKFTRYDEEIARFENDIRSTLYAPAEAAESADELMAILKARAEEEKQKIIEEYEKTTRTIYRTALLYALAGLTSIIALIIILTRIWG